MTRCLHSPREWHQPLYLIKWEHIPQSHQNGHALTSNHGRNTSKNHVRKARPTLTSDHGKNTSKTHVRKAQHSHPTSSCHKGSTLTSDLILLEWLCTYIRPHLVKKALHLHLIMWEHILQSHQNGSSLMLSTQMALLRPSADISYVGARKDIYGLKVA